MEFRRLNYYRVRPEAMRAMRGLGQYQAQGAIEHSLLELVKLRASQINNCGFCIDMQSRDARRAGEREQRLYGLSAWREAPFYSDRERAALAWTEALTRLADGHVSDALYAATREHFSEEELVDLTMAIVTINGWNRISHAFGAVPGSYREPSTTAAD
jgi:AhpD family alkylhydroperoxidase